MYSVRIMHALRRVLVSSLTAAALVGPTLGCYSLRPNSAPTAGQSGRLRLVRDAPVAIVRGKAGSDTLLLRSLNQLEGKLIRVTPDTLTLRLERTWPPSRHAIRQLAVIPRSASIDFAERKLDDGRTMLAVMGLTVVMVYVVWALTWDLDFGEGSTVVY